MWQSYPYLFADLLSLIPVAAAAFSFPKHRRDLLMAGLLFLPAAGRSLAEGAYWQPIRVVAGNFGPEDLLYVIHVATMSWFLAVVAWRRRVELICRTAVDLRRYATVGAMALTTASLADGAGLSSLTGDVAAACVVALWVLARQPALFRFAASGLLLFGTFHWLEQRIWLTLWPASIAAWNPSTFWAALWCGVPSGEVVFHFAFGACSPVAIAWCRHADVAGSTHAGV